MSNLTETEKRRLRESHGQDDPMFIAEAEEAMATAVDEAETFSRMVHGLRSRGWSKSDAEAEAIARIDARRKR